MTDTPLPEIAIVMLRRPHYVWAASLVLAALAAVIIRGQRGLVIALEITAVGIGVLLVLFVIALVARLRRRRTL